MEEWELMNDWLNEVQRRRYEQMSELMDEWITVHKT